MKLNDEILSKLCEKAKIAALTAGEIIKNADRSKLEVDRKTGGENLASQVVTEIDIKAQEAILQKLLPTLKEYDLGLLAEESNDDGSRFSKDYFWCIDPLDGTLAFSRDEDGYSVSIALIKKDGTPIIGVVYDPRSNTLYSAIHEKGAFKNDCSFKVENKGSKLTLLYDQSFLKIKNYDEEIQKLENLALKSSLSGVELHHLGGAVMNGISTIEYAPAIYYKHPKESLGGGSIWDFAASSVIQREAGGTNSNYFGDPLDLNRHDSSFMNHEGVKFFTGICF
ncbi:MAG: inositol monophosphatase [Halobacteriovoraceae bacterium]|nr:inositol monophosphatase [Halobacteriovoraceae bacterium]|tara:strand:+ start:6513 stop:7355 length:843 start_codon:yes stop_codon:yes gene_type:complete